MREAKKRETQREKERTKEVYNQREMEEIAITIIEED